MKVSIIGAGYVGVVLAAGLAELGHENTLVDIDNKKVEMINNKEAPIYEKGLQELLEKHVPTQIKATTDLKTAI